MQIKRYSALSMKEAIDQVKEDLGPNAIILSTQNVNEGEGVLGLLGRKRVEVTAALDRDIVAGQKDISLENTVSNEPVIIEEALRDLRDEIKSLRNKLEQSVSPLNEKDSGIEELRYLARYLEGHLASTSKLPLRPEWISLYQLLVNQGVEARYAMGVISKLQRKISEDKRSMKLPPKRACLEFLSRLIKVSGPIKVLNGRPKVIALVGPTGVGKTTTLAKLAAHYACINDEKKSVALITLDTYRIGAAEQLKIYAQIMDSPIEILHSPDKIQEILKKFSSYDMILIDTAGRSQNNGRQLDELRRLLKRDIPIETHLVLSANTKNSDLDSITSKFGEVGFDRLIFTKLDESSAFGCILNQVIKTSKPLSYITFGQRVPEDIDVAHGYFLGELMLGIGNLEKKYPDQRG